MRCAKRRSWPTRTTWRRATRSTHAKRVASNFGMFVMTKSGKMQRRLVFDSKESGVTDSVVQEQPAHRTAGRDSPHERRPQEHEQRRLDGVRCTGA